MKKLLLLLLMVVTTAVGSWAEESFTITFKTGTTRGNQIGKNTKVATIVNETEIVSSFGTKTNSYGPSIGGLRLAAKSSVGGLDLNLSEAYQVFATKITCEAKEYDNGSCNLSMDGTSAKEVTVEGTEFKTYTFELDGKTKINHVYPKTTTDGGVYISSITVYYKSENQAKPATEITFDPDGGVFTTDQIITLSTDGLDEDGNMLPIEYSMDGSSFTPYVEPFKVESTMTVTAKVGELEVSKTYTINHVVPGDPVVKVNDKVINPESVLPYGTEVTIWSENATKLADEELEEYANPYTFTLTEDYLNTFMGVNGNETSEKTTDVILTLAKPELTATIGDVVVENGGVYHVFPGMEVALEYKNADASSIAVLDAEGEHVAVVDGKFAINAATTYMVSVSAGSNNHADIEFTTEFVDVKLEKATATFDFTVEGAYGLTPYGQHPYSGLPPTQNNYETKITEIKDIESGVVLSFGKTSGNGYRQWCSETGDETNYTTSFDFRLMNGSYMVVSAPEGSVIYNIKAEGSKLTFEGITNNGNGTNADFEINAENVKFSANATKTFKTMTVEYGRTVAANPEKPVVDFDATSNTFKVTVKPGHHVWYRSYSYVPQNKARVAQGAENAEWEKLTESGDVKAEVPTTESGVLHRYEFLSHNPVTKLQSDAVRYSVKADGSLSGVEDVEVESGVEAEYFNLQGVRVAAPLAPGLYIERRGDKAVKVRIN